MAVVAFLDEVLPNDRPKLHTSILIDCSQSDPVQAQ